MKKRLCFKTEIGWTIKLEQTGLDSFTVTYGAEVQPRLDYASAAEALGQCIMHALACEDKLDNRAKGER